MIKYIHAKVTAKAKRESLKQKSPDHFLIFVREPAERNQANTRALALLAEHFKIPKSKIRITNGHKHPSKLIAIES